MADIVLITGLSGAGRSGAADVLEDLGWYVVDNLPTSLVETIVELASKPGSDIERLALVSGRQHVEVLDEGRPRCAATVTASASLFLDASTSGARAPLRRDPAQAPARPTRPTGWSRRSRWSASSLDPVAGRRRSGDRHVGRSTCTS